ncbi:hypothetical protein DUNSADRAFT_16227 [Dunaliella salina]|uniref:Nudix hydrolase domain-containing protein n=1 Tax=Dunaliella salina TaxID=3046 RepID=A0ABQ7H143_DUNSA|nr:hypothetical protein DUNSADRAFT_16227 [Dunaliella salina]|eukprot:KAF5840564.1 hypothetical protein DUNSADRAFT_16227 [Dunaliella salina]
MAYVPPHLRGNQASEARQNEAPLARQEKSYGIFACQDGKILCIFQRKPTGNQWTLCKGKQKIQDRGDPLSTAKRELAEEVDLQVEHLLLQEAEKSEYPNKGKQKVVSMFAASVTGMVKAQTYEVHGHEWLSPSDLIRRLTFTEDREIAGRLIRRLEQEGYKFC